MKKININNITNNNITNNNNTNNNNITVLVPLSAVTVGIHMNHYNQTIRIDVSRLYLLPVSNVSHPTKWTV